MRDSEVEVSVWPQDLAVSGVELPALITAGRW